MWFRDKAFEMKRPSLDRIDTTGDYCLDNCRFIELKENLHRAKRSGRRIWSRDINTGEYFEYESANRAQMNYGFDKCKIGFVLRGIRTKHAGKTWGYV
jgi:hypothetical protein